MYGKWKSPARGVPEEVVILLWWLEGKGVENVYHIRTYRNRLVYFKRTEISLKSNYYSNLTVMSTEPKKYLV